MKLYSIFLPHWIRPIVFDAKVKLLKQGINKSNKDLIEEALESDNQVSEEARLMIKRLHGLEQPQLILFSTKIKDYEIKISVSTVKKFIYEKNGINRIKKKYNQKDTKSFRYFATTQIIKAYV